MKGDIKVGHIKSTPDKEYVQIRADRGSGINKHMGNWVNRIDGRVGVRDEVCNDYDDWFYSIEPKVEQEKHKAVHISVKHLAERVKRGDKLELLCWCYPQRCHLDTIVYAVKKIAKD